MPISGSFQDITENPQVMQWLQQFAAANAAGNPAAAPVPPQGQAAAPGQSNYYYSNVNPPGILEMLKNVFLQGTSAQAMAPPQQPLKPMDSQGVADYAIDQQQRR